MSAEQLLRFLNKHTNDKPASGLIKEYLTQQEFEAWKEFEEDYPNNDYLDGHDPYLARVIKRHGAILRAGHMRYCRTEKKYGPSKKMVEAGQMMQGLVEAYEMALEDFQEQQKGSLILIDGYTAGAPEYIQNHIVDPILVPRSWMTGYKKPSKVSRREKLIQFLEMVSDTDVPLAKFKTTVSDNVAVHTPATIKIKRPDPWSHELFDNPKRK